MKCKFWGVRGSVPAPGDQTAGYGGNTSCIEICFEDLERLIILDAGSGIRELGNDLMTRYRDRSSQQIEMFVTHTHWDHIQGFPFFQPAYDPRRHFIIAIPDKDRKGKDLETVFATQMQSEYFPVPVEKMGASMMFWAPETTRYITHAGVDVIASKHNHPGDAYGYRLEEAGKVLVYCTDIEHGDRIDPNVVALSKNADLLIHDAQYTPEELKEKKGWGHSSWEQAIEVAEQAGVKRLALFHHDPGHTDNFLFRMEEECQRRFPGAFLSREGMEIEI